MRDVCLMEGLEDRRLMSVSGVSLLGPLPTGGQKVEEILVGGKKVGSNVETVVGPVTFNKIKCTEVKSVTVQGSTTTTELQYYNHDKAGNIVILGRSITQKTGSTTNTTTAVLTPDEIIFPVSMDFGKTYNSSWTRVDTTVTKPGGAKTVTHKTVKLSVKLGAAKEVPISIPIGKVNAWLLDETVATTIGGKTTTQAVQVWSVPTEGVAKIIVGTGKTAQTFEVTSLKA